jgi:hypothetical protein
MHLHGMVRLRGPWKKLVENWQIKTELCRAYQSATVYRAEPDGGSEFQLVTNTEQMQVWGVRWGRIAGGYSKGAKLAAAAESSQRHESPTFCCLL